MLKFEVDSLDSIDEAHHGLYGQGEDGVYRLVVDGAVPKAKLDEFRENNVKLFKQVEEYRAAFGDDLDEARKSMQHVRELEEKALSLEKQLETTLVDSALRNAAIDAGALPEAVDDIIRRGKEVFILKDGGAVHRDGDEGISMQQWAEDLYRKAPHLFHKSTGGGARGGDGSTSVTRKSQLSTPKEKADYIRQHGVEKYQRLSP